MLWRCRDLRFDLDSRVLVMGVLNLTPDSFSDGGAFTDPTTALAHAHRMIEQGADLIDLGAESTRPGAAPVAEDEQWRRLEAVLVPLAASTAPAARIALSIDTASAAVAVRALAAGGHAINDVTALSDPGMAGTIAAAGAGVVLMHMQGNPATMQQAPRYEDAAREIALELAERIERGRAAGIAPECIAIDPGIGFGKTARHNLELIARIGELAALGRPVLVGASRKRFLGEISGAPLEQRLEGGLAAHAIAIYEGASIVRTHDVEATVKAVAIAHALRQARRRES